MTYSKIDADWGARTCQLFIRNPRQITVPESQLRLISLKSKLRLAGGRSKLGKALALGKISDMSELLDPKFGKNDKWRKGRTIKNWVHSLPQSLVDKYFKSPENTRFLDDKDNGRQFRAHLVIVVGNRKILLWDGQSNSPRLLEHWDVTFRVTMCT